MGLTFGARTLYLGDVDEPNRKLQVTECNVVESDEVAADPIPYHVDYENSFSAKLNIERNTVLSLIYRRKITNNWLKMHSGIMTRKSSRRKHSL